MVRPPLEVPQTLHGHFKDLRDSSDLTLQEAYLKALRRGLPLLCADLDAEDALDPDPQVEPILAAIAAGGRDGRADHDAAAPSEVSTVLTADRTDSDRDGDHTVADRS